MHQAAAVARRQFEVRNQRIGRVLWINGKVHGAVELLVGANVAKGYPWAKGCRDVIVRVVTAMGYLQRDETPQRADGLCRIAMTPTIQ